MSVNSTDTVTVVPGRLEHCFVLAQNMREQDARELEAIGQSPLEGVLHAHRTSVSAAALLDDVLGAMFGVKEISSDFALLWLLTTPLFERKPIAFFRAARAIVCDLLERYAKVGNVIDGRYTGALRLAAAMGAEFGSPLEIGGVSFVPFTIRRH